MTMDEGMEKEILIVEDSAIQLEMLRRVLTSNGYKVRTAVNGEEGLAAVKERRPDLVISDVLMPVMNGYELCRELKASEALKDIPLILLTQLTEPEEAIRGLEAGADNYITKPFEEEFLVAKVRSLLLFPIQFINNPGEKSVDFTIDGKRYIVKSTRGQTLNFLLSTYENVVRRNLELFRTQEELERLNGKLEEKVKQRTAALAEEMTERKQLSMDLIKRNRELSALYSIYKAADEKPMMRDMLHAALETVMDVLGAETGSVFLLEADQETLSIYSYVGMSEQEAKPFLTLKVGEGMAGKAAMELKPVVMEAGIYPTQGLASAIRAIGLQSMAAVPLISGNGLVGSMSIGSRKPRLFQRDELDMLSAIGRQVGSMVHAARLYGQLKESEEKFQSMAYTASDAVISINGRGNVEFWNAAAERIFGYDKDEVMGKDISMIVPAKFHEQHKNGLIHFRDSGTGAIIGKSRELAAIKKDGTEIPVELAVSGYKLGGAWHAVGIVRDITERKRWAAALEESNSLLKVMVENLKKTQQMLVRSEKLAALGALAAGVAHEIKNPLNIISTSIQILQMKEGLSTEEMTMHSQMMEQVGRMVKIIDNLRDYARERKPEIKDIDVVDLLKKTLALVEYEMRTESINISLRHGAPSLSVRGDRDQLAQVFLNLINNARFSMGEKKKSKSAEWKEGGKVWMGFLDISVESAGGFGVIKFSDNGVGIPRNVVGKIFDPFFTTKAEGKGTGLGLSISLGIIENHHGTIEAESEDGAVFTIRLPMSSTGD